MGAFNEEMACIRKARTQMEYRFSTGRYLLHETRQRSIASGELILLSGFPVRRLVNALSCSASVSLRKVSEVTTRWPVSAHSRVPRSLWQMRSMRGYQQWRFHWDNGALFPLGHLHLPATGDLGIQESFFLSFHLQATLCKLDRR